MKTPALKSRYKKVADLIDMDYAAELPPRALAFLEAFTASYYNGSPSEEPGSVPREESYRLNAERRRDVYGALLREPLPVDQVVDVPAYRSPMADAKKRMTRRQRRKKEEAA